MEEKQFSEVRDLIAFDQQSNSYSAEFFYTAYNIAWGGLQPSSFMTSSAAYTVATPTSQAHGKNSTWTYPATEYSASLECDRAFENQTLFYDSSGCIFNKDAYITNNLINYGIFIGSENAPWSVQGNCSVSGKPRLAVIWEQCSLNGTFLNVLSSTAMFCSPVYYTQEVTIKVTEKGAFLSREITAPRQFLNNDTFDFASFENIALRQDVYNANPLGSFPVNTGPVLPPLRTSNVSSLGIAGYALPFGPAEPADFLQYEILHQSFEAAYRLLFATALNSLLVPSMSRAFSGTCSQQQEAIIVVQTFAMLLECALVIILVFAALLLILTKRRISNLRSDPSSLSHLMSLTSESTHLLEKYRVNESMATPSDRLSLQNWASGAPYRLDVLLSNNTLSHRRKQRIQAGSQVSKIPRMNTPLESSAAFC